LNDSKYLCLRPIRWNWPNALLTLKRVSAVHRNKNLMNFTNIEIEFLHWVELRFTSSHSYYSWS
jgi:hypothetical protein